MSISHKKNIFQSILALFWGSWTSIVYSWLVHFPKESPPGLSNIIAIKREAVRRSKVAIYSALYKKNLFLVNFSSFFGVPAPRKVCQTCPFLDPINHSSPNNDDISIRAYWRWFGFSHD